MPGDGEKTDAVLVCAADGSFCVRAFQARDVPAMARWMSDERILQFYGGRDAPLDEAAVRAKYLGRQGPLLQACWVESADGQPMGYAQYYRLTGDEAVAYGWESAELVWGIDVFLDPAWWNRGVGTRLMQTLLAHLCAVGAECVVVDPRVDNPRAVRSYEKAGFRTIRRLAQHEWHEGRWHDSYLMAAGCQERG